MSDEPEWLKPHGRPWRVDSHVVLHDNPWFRLDAYRAEAPTGAKTDYFLADFKNVAVGVVPLHDDGTVSLIGQWRFPFAAYSWELPEGGVPAGETPLDGAKRELREEAGLEAADWRQVLTMQLSNSSTTEICHCFVATGLTATDHDPDPTEALTSARVPFQEALAAATSGRIQDAMTVASLLRVHHMAVCGELPEPLAARVLGRNPQDAL